MIRSLNNQRTATISGLRDELRKIKPGAPVTLQVQRDGRLMFVSFTLE
jgi:S1-C subfamily serine protease